MVFQVFFISPCKIEVIIIGSLVIVGLYFFKFHGELSNQHDVWGQFGSFWGGTLNPLLSLIAFLALLYTIILQQK